MTALARTGWRDRVQGFREPRGFGPLLIVMLCVPAAVAITGLSSDLLGGTRYFGSNPIKEGEHFLGQWTLRLLVATLTITPLRQLTGWNWLARHRRTLGLFAFGYLTLHWFTYAFLDVQLNWGELTKDLLKRPYIYLGMTALVLMIPLVVTSTKGMIRRLGKRWTKLHRLIYVIAVLGVIHYSMAVKKDLTGPLTYGAILGVLLGWRVVRWRQDVRNPAVRAR